MLNIYEHDYLNLQELSDLDTYIKNMKWWSGMPGGFGTNSPKRLVNSFGDGAEIDMDGVVSPIGIKKTYWTAKITARDYSLHTKTEKMPSALAKIIPFLRDLFKQEYPTALSPTILSISPYAITIQTHHYIAAHTDDNIWYPKNATRDVLSLLSHCIQKANQKMLMILHDSKFLKMVSGNTSISMTATLPSSLVMSSIVSYPIRNLVGMRSNLVSTLPFVPHSSVKTIH